MTSDFGTASSALDKLFKAGSKEWSFAPSATVPIFNAGSLREHGRRASDGVRVLATGTGAGG